MMIKRKLKILSSGRKAAALLVVLFIIMAITILSLGFLSKSDVQLACGENMLIHSQMDYLAESALEHAKGLVLNPQDVASEYWTGADGLQLVTGDDDYYDVRVVRDDSDPKNHCDYIIDCNAYRVKNGEKIGRTSLTAQLRLDPVIAYWSISSTTISHGITINGDVYCAGNLANYGSIDGDVFAYGSIIGSNITGQKNQFIAQPPIDWPALNINDFIPSYYIGSAAYSSEFVSSYYHPSGTYKPSASNPAGIRYRNTDLNLPGSVNIEGMLVVNGNLRVINSSNVISAAKNFPALFVAGDLIIESNSSLEVTGLAIVKGQIRISADRTNLNILGVLFAYKTIVETTADFSGNNNTGSLYNNPIWQPSAGKINGSLQFDGIDDYVRVPDNASFDITSGITVSAWISPSDAYDWRTIVSKFAHMPGWRKDLYWFLYEHRIGASLAGPCGFGNTNWRPDVPIQTDVWTHVALTYNGSAMKMYKNGANVATTNVSGSLLLASSISNESFYIGKNTEWGEYFNGLIDDVRIYNRALDANDIYPPKDGLAGLVGHWKLDEAGSNVTITAAPAKAAIEIWPNPASPKRWKQAGGAFFRSIQRR